MKNLDSHNTNELQLVWKETDPVQLSNSIDMNDFRLESYSVQGGSSKTSTGTYSHITLNFELTRSPNYYLMTIYIPSAMIVIVSFLSFWVDVKNQALKSTITLVSLLTLGLSLIFLNTTSVLPRVTYTKAIDLWTGVCLTFIFAALVESIIVYHRHRMNTNNPADENQQDKQVSLFFFVSRMVLVGYHFKLFFF